MNHIYNFDSLKELLFSNKWPVAVNPLYLADLNSYDDKIKIGDAVLKFFVKTTVQNKKFLDFGCGEGFSAFSAYKQKSELSVGYDVKLNHKFERQENFFITDNIEEVRSNGRYDFILINDVLDHSLDQDPIDLLIEVKNLLKLGGRIFVRFHPMISAHGSHLFHELNKAFVHLVFSEKELNEMGFHFKKKILILNPEIQYEAYLKKSGMKIVSKNIFREKLDPFFQQPCIAEKIKKNLQVESIDNIGMDIQFADFELNKSNKFI